MPKVIKCHLCESKLNQNAIGLNKKFFSKKNTHLLCIHCLAAHLDVSEEDLFAKIEEFKAEGCKLFS